MYGSGPSTKNNPYHLYETLHGAILQGRAGVLQVFVEGSAIEHFSKNVAVTSIALFTKLLQPNTCSSSC